MLLFFIIHNLSFFCLLKIKSEFFDQIHQGTMTFITHYIFSSLVCAIRNCETFKTKTKYKKLCKLKEKSVIQRSQINKQRLID